MIRPFLSPDRRRALLMKQALAAIGTAITLVAILQFVSGEWKWPRYPAAILKTPATSKAKIAKLKSIPAGTKTMSREASKWGTLQRSAPLTADAELGPQTTRSPNQPRTIILQIDGSQCSYLFRDFDTGLPSSDAGLCTAESHPKMKNGSRVAFVLSCNMQLATCMRLGYGQTYEMELVDDNQYPECGRSSKEIGCVKVHARPYDLIYHIAVEIDCNDEANQVSEDCKANP
jgi:hypothetical protein